jgi:hypothetical protein
MPWVKGQSGNLNGLPKGYKRQKTTQWLALRDSIVGCHAEKFNEILSSMAYNDPEKFVDIYLRILEYFQPKLGRIEQAHELNEGSVIELNIVSSQNENNSDTTS